jgi:hypothetical protein
MRRQQVLVVTAAHRHEQTHSGPTLPSPLPSHRAYEAWTLAKESHERPPLARSAPTALQNELHGENQVLLACIRVLAENGGKE